MTNKRDKNHIILDTVYGEIARDEAKEAGKRELTAEDRALIAEMDASARALIREQRKKALEAAQAEVRQPKPQPVPLRILAMTRDAVVSRLSQLAIERPELAVQFRNLEELSSADLQRLLADIEEQLGAAEDDAE